MGKRRLLDRRNSTCKEHENAQCILGMARSVRLEHKVWGSGRRVDWDQIANGPEYHAKDFIF